MPKPPKAVKIKKKVEPSIELSLSELTVSKEKQTIEETAKEEIEEKEEEDEVKEIEEEEEVEKVEEV